MTTARRESLASIFRHAWEIHRRDGDAFGVCLAVAWRFAKRMAAFAASSRNPFKAANTSSDFRPAMPRSPYRTWGARPMTSRLGA